MRTYCILCQTELLVLNDVFANGQHALFCNHADCPRFGLLTVISSPVGKVGSLEEEEYEEEDSEDEHKEVQ